MEWGDKKDTWRVPILSWCNNVEGDAMEQAAALAQHPVVFHHVALMPDCHPGKGMPIGGVIACENAVIPNAIGADIGCGVSSVQTNIPAHSVSKDQIAQMVNDIKKVIPVGFAHQQKDQEWDGFNNVPMIPIIHEELASAKKQLGTLGAGNHFLEIQAGDDGLLWVMLHSGSRNFGYKIAKHFNERAISLCKKWHSALPSPDLAFLPMDMDSGFKYITAMQYAMKFAAANRALMMDRAMQVVSRITGAVAMQAIDIPHNYAQLEHHFGHNVWIHRKGATLARKGETSLIPGSMGTPSYVVKGLGNADSFQSCSHGAGRISSRTEFRRTHTLEECNKSIEGLVFSGWGKTRHGEIDTSEAPGAYKNIDEVMDAQKDLVEIVTKLTPLGSVKG